MSIRINNIKIKIFCLYIVLCILFAFISSEDLTYYRQLNNRINTLEEYKDNDNILKVKLKHLEYINDVRAKYGAQPLKLDILASRVANKHAVECVTNRYVGHINKSGYLPYMRYGITGATEHIVENIANIGYIYTISNSNDTQEELKKEFREFGEDTLIYMKQSLDAFMSEGPGGGHYENVIMPCHNYVGLGYAEYIHFNKDTVMFTMVYVEDYVDRYINFKSVPDKVSADREFNITGEMIYPDYGIYAVRANYVGYPKKQSDSQISRSSQYNDYTDYVPIDWGPFNLKQYVNGNNFSIPLKLSRKGYYYIQIYVKSPKSSIPYSGGYASANDAVIASGIIVEVK